MRRLNSTHFVAVRIDRLVEDDGEEEIVRRAWGDQAGLRRSHLYERATVGLDVSPSIHGGWRARRSRLHRRRPTARRKSKTEPAELVMPPQSGGGVRTARGHSDTKTLLRCYSHEFEAVRGGRQIAREIAQMDAAFAG